MIKKGSRSIPLKISTEETVPLTLTVLRTQEQYLESTETGIAHQKGNFRLAREFDGNHYYWTVEERSGDIWEDMTSSESPFLSKAQAEGAYVALLSGRAPSNLQNFRKWKEKRYSGVLRI